MKNCSNANCKQLNPQPLDSFGRDRNNESGFSSRCLPCKREDNKRYTTNLAKRDLSAFLYPEFKTCSSVGCSQVNPQKSVNFYKNNKKIDGLHDKCKTCSREKSNNFRISHLEQTYESQQKWRGENPDYRERYDFLYPGKSKAAKRKWNSENKDYFNEREKRKRDEDVGYRILGSLRARTREALKGNSKSKSTEKLLGCTIDFLRQHIESLFEEGMTWDNYGRYGWHLDHIIPCDAFELQNSEEQEVCFHYTNLQPLWAPDNLLKSSKIIF